MLCFQALFKIHHVFKVKGKYLDGTGLCQEKYYDINLGFIVAIDYIEWYIVHSLIIQIEEGAYA